MWDISEGPSQLQSSLWLIKVNFSLCPILVLSLHLIHCWQEHSSITFLHPSLHLKVGFPAHYFLSHSSTLLFFLFLSPLSSPFLLCVEWPYIPVCWEESYFTPGNLVTHLVSVPFNSQKGPDLDCTLYDQNSLNSSLLHHTHILYTYILLGAGNTDMSKRFQSSEPSLQIPIEIAKRIL